MPGRWGINENLGPCGLPEELASAFTQLLGNIQGARYTPILYCGSQVVAGTNYMVLAKQEIVCAEMIEKLVKIIFYKNLQNEFSITSIESIM